nr:hypothetical protein [Delftia tsuruhatensis]
MVGSYINQDPIGLRGDSTSLATGPMIL